MSDRRGWGGIARSGGLLVALIGAAIAVNFVLPLVLLRFPRIFVQVQPYIGTFGSVLFSALLLFAYLGVIGVQERQESIQEAQKELSERQQRFRELEYHPFLGSKRVRMDGEVLEVTLVNDGRGRAENLALWMDVFLAGKHVTEYGFEKAGGHAPSGGKSKGIQPTLYPLRRDEPDETFASGTQSGVPGPGEEKNWIVADGEPVTFYGRIRFRENTESNKHTRDAYTLSELWDVLVGGTNGGKRTSGDRIVCRLSLVYHDEFGDVHTERLRSGVVRSGELGQEFTVEEFFRRTNGNGGVRDDEVLRIVEEFGETPSSSEEVQKGEENTVELE